MKKILYPVCVAAAVLFGAVSCQKDAPTVDNTPSVISPDDGTDEEPEPDPSELLPIKIDADFSDWDALDASKVAETVCAEDAKWKALKKMRVYANDDYIWMYFELDESMLKTDAGAVLNVFFNADNDPSTGGNPLGEHLGNDVDYMLQGYCYQPGGYSSWSPTFWQYSGKVGAVEWKWDNISASGIGSGSGKAGKYELQIMRLMMDVPFADTFTVGVDLQQNWISSGVLPNAKGGAAEKLAVTIDKK